MTILNNSGAFARAVAVYRAASRPEPSESVADAYASALDGLGDKRALADLVATQFLRTTSTIRMQRLAQHAERAGDGELERRILERIVALGGDRPQVQRRLGVLAFQRRSMAEAERCLSAYVANTDGDYEIFMLLGDIASHRRDADAARARYAKSLTVLRGTGDRSFRARNAEAHLLHRLKQDDASGRLYEALIAEKPNDKGLRADYVAMLMERGDLRRAREVLHQP
jgi:uncharacterized protein HemY